MIVVTFINHKGGTGKTTFSGHIAAGLAIEGYRVVMFDADPQANLTFSMGINPSGRFYDLCVRPNESTWMPSKWYPGLMTQVHPEIYAPPDSAEGELWIVPGDEQSRNILTTMQNQLVLKQRLAEIKDLYDFAIIDSSPTPSMFNAVLVVSSDYIVIPTDAEPFSALKGTPATYNNVISIRNQLKASGLSAPDVLGILPNKVRPHNVTHEEIKNILYQKYNEHIFNPFPLRTAIPDVQALGRTLFTGVRKDKSANSATDHMWRLVDDILLRVGA